MGRNIGVMFAVGAGLQPSVSSTFATVEDRIKSLRANLKDLQAVSTRAAALSTAEARLQAAQAAHGSNPTEENRRQLVSAQRAYTSAERAARKYNVTVADAAKVHARATEEIAKTEAALRQQEQLQANQARRRELHSQMLGTVASFAAVAAPVKLAIDYESVMADVRKVTDFDAPGWEKFSQDLLELSTRIPMSAKGLAEIAAAAGQAGIAEEELIRFTEDAAIMAVAFGISAEEAGSAMTGLRTNFALSQDGVIGLGDAINHLANNMDATAGDIINFANRLGGVASIYGFTGEEVGALASAFVAMKTPAEIAARASNALFMKLGNAGSQSDKAQEAFQRLGFTGEEMSRAFKEDAQGSLLIFLEALQRSEDPMRELNAIMGEGYADDVAKLVNGLDHYKSALGLIGQESVYAGSMLEEYSVRSGTTANSIDLLKNSASRLAIILGTTVLPGLTAVAMGGVKLLEPIASLAKEFPQVTTAVFAVIFGLATLKLAALAGAYAGTILSDGWIYARRVFALLRPSVLAAKAALIGHRVAALATAAAGKVLAAGQMAINLAMRVGRSGIIANTAAMVAHRTTSLALAAGTKVMAAAQWLLNAAMLANPIVWIVLAVAALAVGFVLLHKRSEKFRAVLGQLKSVAATVFAPLLRVWETVKGVWGAATGFFSNIWLSIKGDGELSWSGIKTAASEAWSGLRSTFSPAISFFSGLWDDVSLFASSTWDSIRNRAATTWSGVQNSFQGTKGFFADIWENVSSTASSNWGSITAAASSTKQNIDAFFQPVTNFFNNIWNGIMAGAETCFNWISSKFDWVKSKFEWITNGWGAVKNFFGFGEEEEAFAQTTAIPTMTARTGTSPVVPGLAPALVAMLPAHTPISAPVFDFPEEATTLPPYLSTSSEPAVSSSNQNVALNPQINLQVTLNGVPSSDVGEMLLEAIKSNEPEMRRYFSRLLESIAADQLRVSYAQ